ncbi:UNVERIFIED_CONTAM: hypothetical protein Slati_2938800 [Sesamum latifolium]|uniref:Uncharacterized protein n=1 Tax=Sesamum latifolium TaxID=2727402 RepID=A0AAW2VFA4_9LAMI
MALDVEVKKLITYSDFQLVTNQVESKYEVKEERMKEYLQENRYQPASKLSAPSNPRTKNTKVDYLARLPNFLVDCNTRTITVRTFVKNPLRADIAVMQVETDWRKPLLDYLTQVFSKLMRQKQPA